MSVTERVARSVALEQAYVYDVYEQLDDNLRSKPWPKVQEFLDSLEAGSIVCDVGSGNGKYLNLNTSIFTMGGDKSNKLCEMSRTKDNEILLLDNLSLPYRDDSLDGILSIAVVHHFTTTERRVCALRELARVLRIGGRIIISVWAMEQSSRRFESQDVLVPWHKHKHVNSPILEFAANSELIEREMISQYLQPSESEWNKYSNKVKKKMKAKTADHSNNAPKTSPGSSSLSSPNETCYSFVRKAIQKLASGRKVHRPWFLDGWGNCAKDLPPKRYDPDGCECCEFDIQDLPIELRRVDDDDLPQRRLTFPSSQLLNNLPSGCKSQSMSNIKSSDNQSISRSHSNIADTTNGAVQTDTKKSSIKTSSKPKLVKQKQSICDDEAEALDQHTDMQSIQKNFPDVRLFSNKQRRATVLKQRSLNEELMSDARMQEKQKLRQQFQKQTSLNDDLMYQRETPTDNIKDSFFSSNAARRLHLIKTGFANKLKTSTTNIEKVTSSSFKNGFVKILQNWKPFDLASPSPKDEDYISVKNNAGCFNEEKRDRDCADGCERRLSKEEGSDSSKDSSLQSDTSVDSEDSFASVIFIPKSNSISPTLSPGVTSPRVLNCAVPNSPKIKQSSCPTSPRIRQMPLSIYPLTKQLSSPKPSTTILSEALLQIDWKAKACKDIESVNTKSATEPESIKPCLSEKYSVQQIPKFKKSPAKTESLLDTCLKEDSAESLVKPEDKGAKKSTKSSNYPIVRHVSVCSGKHIVKPLPKLLSLELFNPETDDKDSDSSAVSSPDSVDSVVSVHKKKLSLGHISHRLNPTTEQDSVSSSTQDQTQKLLQAAVDVANSLDDAVDKVIRSNPRIKVDEVNPSDIQSIMDRQYTTESTPLLGEDQDISWNKECQKHLTHFADKLSEKLQLEINKYQAKNCQFEVGLGLALGSSSDHIRDPYINRLSEELYDLSKLSAEIQKQNEYLAKLSVSDQRLVRKACHKCRKIPCKCDEHNKNFVFVGESSCELRLSKQPDKSLSSSNISSEHDAKSPEGSSQSSIVLLKTDCRQEVSSELNSFSKPFHKPTIKSGTSIESCDSEKGSSSNSIMSSTNTSIHFGHSVESTEYLSEKDSSESHKDTNSVSRYSDGGSTASLASCPEWKTIRNKIQTERSASEDKTDGSTSSKKKSKNNCSSRLQPSHSDTSQESLPSDNIGGEITYHRFYHVFREGELDQLIEKYVENLHIISSYYDHASWCIVAEKVQVWTI